MNNIIINIFLFSTSLFVLFLFFTWWWRSHDKKILQQHLPSGQFISVDGFQIHYQQWGQHHKSNLLLIHGIGANIYPWRKIIPILAEEYKVTAIDLPGFGHSSKIKEANYGLDEQAKRVQEFCQTISITPTTLVGSSMGGAISLWAAHLYPETFPRVVGLAPGIGKRWETAPALSLLPLASLFQKILSSKIIHLLYRPVVANQENIHPEAIYSYARPYIQDENAVHCFLKAAGTVLRDDRLWKEMKNFKSKVLILYGEQDKLVSKRAMIKANKILPTGELHHHPQAGHHSMEDDPAWIVAKIQDFLKKS